MHRPTGILLMILHGLCMALPVCAQHPAGFGEEDAHEVLLQHLEGLMDGDMEGTVPSSLVDVLESFAAHPINLNRTSERELRQLVLLNELQIHALLRHIEEHGRLISIYELQAIQGFDPHTIQAILPFVTIGGEHGQRRHFGIPTMIRDGENVLFLRYQQMLERQLGFSSISDKELMANPNARYLGSPFRLYARYRFTYYQNVSIGITAEKDPGEEFFRGSQPYGFDFYSAHLHLRDFGRLRTLSAGDFQAQFGQGLVLWSGMGFGKSSDAIGVRKNSPGLRQYTSVDENNFFRGIGATVDLKPFALTAFFSSKRRDANLCDQPPGDQKVITSLQQSGLHRTPRELTGRNAVRETVFGGNLSYSGRRFSLGVTGYHLELGAVFQRSLSFHNQFDFSNNTYLCGGLDYSYLVRNLNVFGEVAVDQNGGLAFLNGIMASLHRRMSVAVIHRSYRREYQAVMATAFGENTRASNENGLYIGVDIRPAPSVTIHAFADHFSFPWMKHRTYMPSKGYDYLLNIRYAPTREMEITARLRWKNKPLNAREPHMVQHLDQAKREQYRLHLSYPVTQSISMRNRLEAIFHQHGQERQKGFMAYHDILYRNLGSPFAVTLRYALFSTGGFDSRIYAYEHDVLYAFSFPFYADKGMRTYLLVRYRIVRNVDVYVRMARTVFSNRDHSGSGLDRIEGNTRTEAKAQIRWRF